MKLKRLELCGFKSFPDRTVFEFEDSLSALVGPNGSGKSNVVDAIKWVLGERSAQKLRGSEMASLIFNGSRNRKPLGRAEVKLAIDNADGWLDIEYEEVCITRRVDRTGQSEYLINGNTCRLADIRALLMDTGVGTSAYSFIEQGQVDQLLRSSASERRQVFEEAAGINRFLEQVRHAERKLDRVTQNLARVTDIVQEVERQLRSVKYQAGRARTFKRQTARLERLRLAQSLHAYSELTVRREQLRRRVQDAQGARDVVIEEARSLEAELDAARTDLETARQSLGATRQEQAETQARIESLGREAELNRRRAQELAEQTEQVRGRREGIEQSIKETEQEIASARKKLATSAEHLKEQALRHAEQERRVEHLRERRRAASAELERSKDEVFDLYQNESRLANQHDILQAERQTLKARAERLNSRRAKVSTQLDEVQSERSEAICQLERAETREAELRQNVHALQGEISGLEQRVEEVSSEEANTRSELSRRCGRRDALHDLEARAEGVRSGAKRLLDADLPGRLGMVAELIQAPFELAHAVDSALEERAQAVVFTNANSAGQALALLLDEQAGRADVIALDRARAPMIEAPPGTRRLSELVTWPDEVESAARMLLDAVFLADDASAAESLAAAGLPHGSTVVTPDGRLYTAAGIWRAGKSEAPGLISRRSELADLKQQTAALEDQLAELCQRKQDWLRLRTDQRAQLQALTQELDTVSRTAGNLRSRLESSDRRVNELTDEIELARSESQAVEQQMAELAEKRAHLDQQAAEARRAREQAEAAARQLEQQVRALQNEEHELTRSANELSNELARCRERHHNLESLIERLRADLDRRSEELCSLDDERERNERLRREAELAATRVDKTAEERRRHKAKLAELIQQGAQKVESLQQRIAERTHQARAAADRREEAEQRLQELRMAENEAAVKLEDLVGRAAEDYGVRLMAFRMEPERWRDEPPFITRRIREFTEQPEPTEAPSERVASWYRQMTGEAEEQEPARDEGPELIALAEATQLRADVLQIAEDDQTDWQQVRREIATLKAKVDRIGNVNVDAIREQDELETRLQFLTDQKEDLEKARRHEREIIRELNKKSRARFAETFAEVRENFQTLFRKLFGGGQADLVLEEEAEDILQAGIEIVARPPGKETTNITMLSGGEKAMTTVALLFAMFQAKPSPFCLLDEVDAPLDDANVERFLMLLGEFRRDTQFIIITHNKMTMNAAQVLYGLTMTDGVSRQISVRFEDIEQMPDDEPLAKAG